MSIHTALRLQLLLALGCGRETTTACMGISEGAECPAPEDVDPGELTPALCGAEVISVDDGPYEGECWYGPGGSEDEHPGCTYDVTVATDGATCTYGRPCGVESEQVSRSDWVITLYPRLHGVARPARAAEWTAIALAEHASIASFSRVILELLALGAPAALVRDAQRALGDEIRHAELAFGLASAFAGRPIGPGPLPTIAPPAAGLRAFAVAAVQEGCLAETRSVLQIAARAEAEADPAVARVLTVLAADERRHAALAWRMVQWAIQQGGEPVAQAVSVALSAAPRDRVWREVIAPVARSAGMLAA